MKTLRQCTDRQEWDEYVLDNCGHPLQLWGWGEVKSAHGWSADRLFLTDDSSQIFAAAQVLTKKLPWPFKSIAYIPRGPVAGGADSGELLDILAEYIKKTYHSVVLKVEPDSTDFSVNKNWQKSENFILQSWTISIDLKKSEADLLADIENQTRRYIRKSDIETITIKKIHNKEDLTKCLKIYHDTSKRAKFALHKDDYYYDIFDKLGDNSPVFAAFVDDQPVAFLWLAISSEVAFELYAGMNNDGRQLNANYALKWYAIRKCKEWGIKRYDFGGMIAGGVESFKRGWTKQDTKLAGTFDRPLSIYYGIWDRVLPLGKVIIRKIKSIIRH